MGTAFFIEFNGKRFPWNSMENIPWNSMEIHAQYQTEFHGIPWKKFHGIPWNSMGLFYTGMTESFREMNPLINDHPAVQSTSQKLDRNFLDFLVTFEVLLISKYIFCIPVRFPNCCKTARNCLHNFSNFTRSYSASGLRDWS